MKNIIYILILIFACISCKKDPVADFKIEGITKVGEKLSFINTSEHSNSYYWDFNDGSTSSEENPTHVYAKPGNYNVKLDAIGSKGSASMIKPLKITGTTFSFKNNLNINLPDFNTFYWNGTNIEDFLIYGLLLSGSETNPIITTRSEIMFGFRLNSIIYIGVDSYLLVTDRHNQFIIDNTTNIYHGKGETKVKEFLKNNFSKIQN